MKEHKGMRPHDVVVLLKIISLSSGWLNKDISYQLHIAPSEISESLNRSAIAGLISPDKRKVFKNALLKFLEYGLPFIYPAEYGPIERGVPTAHSADVLKDQFVSAQACVWPYANGKVKGHAIQPLYPKQVIAALHDQRLYDMLALVDAIRVGKSREKAIAVEYLSNYFNLDA
jgi:hypothetical protein